MEVSLSIALRCLQDAACLLVSLLTVFPLFDFFLKKNVPHLQRLRVGPCAVIHLLSHILFLKMQEMVPGQVSPNLLKSRVLNQTRCVISMGTVPEERMKTNVVGLFVLFPPPHFYQQHYKVLK